MEPLKDANINNVDEAMLLRYITGDSSGEEKSLVESWVQMKEDNKKELVQFAKIYYAQLTHRHIVDRDSEAAFNKTESAIRKKRRIRAIRRVLSAAAIFALAVTASVFTYFLSKGERANIQHVTIKSNSGMRTNFNLPDGTLVCLNSGSSLTYSIPFGKGGRNVELEGEGYFDVTHDTKRPFIVNVLNDALQVKVTGTQFNVQAYPSDETISTTLVDGKISLSIPSSDGRKATHPMLPSERAIYDKDKGDLHISKVNTAYETAWISGKLMFKETPLPDVMKKLSHYYNVSFYVNDSVINSYAFTGTFENKQLSQVLDYLRISSMINYKIVSITEDDSRETQHTKVILSK